MQQRKRWQKTNPPVQAPFFCRGGREKLARVRAQNPPGWRPKIRPGALLKSTWVRTKNSSGCARKNHSGRPKKCQKWSHWREALITEIQYKWTQNRHPKIGPGAHQKLAWVRSKKSLGCVPKIGPGRTKKVDQVGPKKWPGCGPKMVLGRSPKLAKTDRKNCQNDAKKCAKTDATDSKNDLEWIFIGGRKNSKILKMQPTRTKMFLMFLFSIFDKRFCNFVGGVNSGAQCCRYASSERKNILKHAWLA